MTTVGQFNRVWTDYSQLSILAGGLTDEAKAEIGPLWTTFSTAFQEHFGVSVQGVDTVPQDSEIIGSVLEALRAWIERVNPIVNLDYLALCGMH